MSVSGGPLRTGLFLGQRSGEDLCKSSFSAGAFLRISTLFIKTYSLYIHTSYNVYWT